MKKNNVKRLLFVLTLLSVAITIITGCGKKSRAKYDPVNEGYLPTRIENIKEGGTIPSGCEAKVEKISSDIETMDLLGNWVLSDESKKLLEENEITTRIFEKDASDEKKRDECLVSGFPYELELYSWDSPYYYLGFDNRPLYLGEDLSVDELYTASYGSTLNPENFSWSTRAFYTHGYGIGAAQFDYIEDREHEQMTEDEMQRDVEAWAVAGAKALGHLVPRKIIYDLNDGKLNIGILDDDYFFSDDLSDNDKDTSDIYEMDFDISWNKAEIQLTAYGVTVSYYLEGTAAGVPVVEEYDSEWYGPVDCDNLVDNIIGMHIKSGESQIMTNPHDGYIEADIVFDNDKIRINGKEYGYRYSNNALILSDSDNWYAYRADMKAIESGVGIIGSGIDVYGTSVRIGGSQSLRNLVDYGFDANIDLESLLSGCTVSDDIKLSALGSEMTVRVTNVYDYAKPIGDCLIASVVLDDDQNIITHGSTEIGKSSRNAIYFNYREPFENKPDELVYKTIGTRTYHAGDMIIGLEGGWGYFGLDEIPALSHDSVDHEVHYKFNDDILQKVEIISPSLLYLNMQDNVETSKLPDMSMTELKKTIEIRDTVLERLESALEEADVPVTIDENTGEITLSNDILFGFDSSELSPEGKNYIFRLMSIYSRVLLDPEIEAAISAVQFEGHTDSVGGYEYNLDLSQRRSDSVLSYCLEQVLDGEYAQRLETKATSIGRAFTDPVLSEDGTEQRDKSRRVTIKFLVSVQ